MSTGSRKSTDGRLNEHEALHADRRVTQVNLVKLVLGHPALKALQFVAESEAWWGLGSCNRNCNAEIVNHTLYLQELGFSAALGAGYFVADHLDNRSYRGLECVVVLMDLLHDSPRILLCGGGRSADGVSLKLDNAKALGCAWPCLINVFCMIGYCVVSRCCPFLHCLDLIMQCIDEGTLSVWIHHRSRHSRHGTQRR